LSSPAWCAASGPRPAAKLRRVLDRQPDCRARLRSGANTAIAPIRPASSCAPTCRPGVNSAPRCTALRRHPPVEPRHRDHREGPPLESYGGGVRFTLPGAARIDITYAHPLDPPLLTGASAKVPKDRVLVSLTAQARAVPVRAVMIVSREDLSHDRSRTHRRRNALISAPLSPRRWRRLRSRERPLGRPPLTHSRC
jgi:hypothetical protein